MYSDFAGNESTDYGLRTEPVARKKFEEDCNITIEETGLWLDREFPFLGASPDGLISTDSVAEIKCPKTAQNMKPADAIAKGQVKFCTIDENGFLHLSRKHNFYCQVQGQLHIIRRDVCIFILYCGGNYLYERIYRDDSFWDNGIKQKIEKFYYECLLPEIIDPRKERGMKIKDPIRKKNLDIYIYI